ncbi:hypothetical protein HHI36_001143 [Cryptolaemus montrouzieri]|uniref:UBX domain-containing protein 4 n=1 Tax=Cryptolaemus montrouzieri TaxID=559131 RepID=A0ABD2P762_9CUCU
MSDLWDQGDIANAVNKAKTQGAIFLVFVEGDNELSAHYEKLFRNEEIRKKLATQYFVAIKVQENSSVHQQFNAIYPHNSVPSIFFIGKNGKPLEIITENIQTEDFNKKITAVLEKGEIITQPGSSSINMINQEQEMLITSNIPTTSSLATSSPLVDTTSTQFTTDLSPEEKVQHAKELIEQKRQEKRAQELETERLKELERRKIGQNVQQMKKWQQDEELRQLKEERDREKRENQEARDKVLAQIAQDKAERAARFSQQGQANILQAPQPVAQSSRSIPNTNTTKLQFRLPDGSQHTHEFQISDSLEMVHQYIQNQLIVPFNRYTLSTTFPRREFTTNDNSQSLLDLQLVPNAVILILPQNQGVISTSSREMVGNMLWWLLAPFFNIYDFLVGYFFGRPPTTRSVESTSVKKSTSNIEESNRYFFYVKRPIPKYSNDTKCFNK